MNGMIKVAKAKKKSEARDELRRHNRLRRLSFGLQAGMGGKKGPTLGGMALGAGTGLLYDSTLGQMVDNSIDDSNIDEALQTGRKVYRGGLAAGAALGTVGGAAIGADVGRRHNMQSTGAFGGAVGGAAGGLLLGDRAGAMGNELAMLHYAGKRKKK